MKNFIKTLTTCIVLVLTMVLFTACVPSDVDSATKKMKEEGYSVLPYTINSDGVQECIIAKESGLFDTDFIIAIWFDSVDNAKKFIESYDLGSNELIKRTGKCVYYGTADAIEDFED